jgi:DNA-directed RNA polymerase subunit RPC12/RpoP
VISKRDALLGRMAVEKGLISPSQLEDSLREQERSPHTLGEVLVRRGSLKASELQGLFEALSLDEVQHLQKTEYLFGQILVRQNLATQLQVNKCLEIQQKMAEKGASPLPRLGELLLEHGFIDRKTIAQVLREQEKALFSCARCGKRYNVVGVEKERRYLCRGCGAPLVPAAEGAALDVDDTLFGFELPSDRT